MMRQAGKWGNQPRLRVEQVADLRAKVCNNAWEHPGMRTPAPARSSADFDGLMLERLTWADSRTGEA